jgi:hypothetical protein
MVSGRTVLCLWSLKEELDFLGWRAAVVIQSAPMKYSKSLLLYQDAPAYGLLLKIILPIVPLILVGSAVYLQMTGEETGAIVLTGESFLVALVFWMVFPRKYRVYEDHLSVALGGPLSVNIGFDRIVSIEVTSRTAFTSNFVTRMARTYVLITRKRGLSIAITPKSYDSFVQNANLALSEWRRTTPPGQSGRDR